jgi:rhamnosyltransferase
LTAPVSVLLVVRDGMATLAGVLDAVGSQRTDFPTELVAVDSGSRDGSRELLAERGVRVVDVAASAFDHGLTRNAGIAACRGEFVALLVQDAEPANERWLAELVAPLRESPAVAGTYARQLPRADAGPVTRMNLENWAGAAPSPRLQRRLTAGEYDALAPADRYTRCIFDDVSSCVRRSVWERIPFRAAAFGEDVAWAKEVLLAGHDLVYAPSSLVLHSHDRSAGHEFARSRLEHRQLRELFGLELVPSVRHLALAAAANLPRHARAALTGPLGRRGRVRELARGLALAVAYPWGQYLGAREAREAAAR